MLYDPSNPIVQLCVKGIETEYAGDVENAKALYEQAWQQADTPLEKLTAAHYVARIQPDAEKTLHWNLLSLELAGQVNDPILYPSLQLNVARSYEDISDPKKACEYYEKAEASAQNLPTDGYGEMIRKGILAGLDRVCKHNKAAL